MDFFIEACFRFATYHFDGKITEVLKLLLQQDAKPTKERNSIPVTVRLSPEVYEALQRLNRRAGAAGGGSKRAAAPPETPLISSLIFGEGQAPLNEMPRSCIILN